ncbi:MAG TPA: alkaline phosphatase family protein [Actinomycetota bacterium]|nr:alkaline phosphatase family protein [Actinomycetota bacterium]
MGIRGLGVVALTALMVASGCTKGREVGRPSTRPTPTHTTMPQGDPKHLSQDARRVVSAACKMPAAWVERVWRGWDPGPARGYDLSVVPHPPNWMGSVTDTSHSGPYPFLQQIPLVFYGPRYVVTGDVKVRREVTIADVAPTTAELLDFDFPPRDSRPITEVLKPNAPRPKLIVTALIDGGGWNVLDRWTGRWPEIASLMKRGANVKGVIAGSSPSITPAIHTNMSTGAFPRRHGITAIKIRTDNGHLTDAFVPYTTYTKLDRTDPTANTDITTLGDLYDLETNNDALVGMVSPGLLQFGMMSMGAGIDGADQDVAAILNDEEQFSTNPRFYSLPDYVSDVPGPESELDAVDRSDGRLDGLWHDHSMPPVDATPAFAPWENRIMQALIDREGFGDDDTPDLFYVNYKAPDKTGHAYNMISDEEGEVVSSVDGAVGDMIRWLDRNVGRRNYVFILTADHGQTPLDGGGWPIRPTELTEDLNARFDSVSDDRGLVQDTSATTLFIDRKEVHANGIEPEELAMWLMRYTIGANVDEGDAFPPDYGGREDEVIYDAVIPGRLVDDVYEECGPRH